MTTVRERETCSWLTGMGWKGGWGWAKVVRRQRCKELREEAVSAVMETVERRHRVPDCANLIMRMLQQEWPHFDTVVSDMDIET